MWRCPICKYFEVIEAWSWDLFHARSAAEEYQYIVDFQCLWGLGCQELLFSGCRNKQLDWFDICFQDGDYNKPIPAQFMEELNHPITAENKEPLKKCWMPSEPSPLCNLCSHNQILKVHQLADFVPENEVRLCKSFHLLFHTCGNIQQVCTHQGVTVMIVLLSGTSRISVRTSRFSQLLVVWTSSFSGIYFFEVADKSISHLDKYKFPATCPADKSSKSLMSCPAHCQADIPAHMDCLWCLWNECIPGWQVCNSRGTGVHVSRYFNNQWWKNHALISWI